MNILLKITKVALQVATDKDGKTIFLKDNDGQVVKPYKVLVNIVANDATLKDNANLENFRGTVVAKAELLQSKYTELVTKTADGKMPFVPNKDITVSAYSTDGGKTFKLGNLVSIADGTTAQTLGYTPNNKMVYTPTVETVTTVRGSVGKDGKPFLLKDFGKTDGNPHKKAVTLQYYDKETAENLAFGYVELNDTEAKVLTDSGVDVFTKGKTAEGKDYIKGVFGTATVVIAQDKNDKNIYRFKKVVNLKPIVKKATATADADDDSQLPF
jgi:hypothetical protein